MTLRRDRVRLPGGAVIEDFCVLEYPAWVNVLAVAPDDRAVLVRQYLHPVGRVDFELPGGVADPADPSPEAAARRELLEETGYGGGAWRPRGVTFPNSGTHTNLVYSFLAEGVELVAPPAPEPTEQIEVVPTAVADPPV